MASILFSCCACSSLLIASPNQRDVGRHFDDLPSEGLKPASRALRCVRTKWISHEGAYLKFRKAWAFCWRLLSLYSSEDIPSYSALDNRWVFDWTMISLCISSEFWILAPSCGYPSSEPVSGMLECSTRSLECVRNQSNVSHEYIWVSTSVLLCKFVPTLPLLVCAPHHSRLWVASSCMG